jgi:hydroxymethylbilane synthase
VQAKQGSPAGKIRIGTRGSPLALWQAHETRRALMAAHGLAEDRFEITVIKTSGDRIQDRPLSEVGGKGLFTKEIDEAMIAHEIDIAVHSMKDLPTKLPYGFAVGAVLPRFDVRDAFVSLKHPTLASLPQGATLGTSSLRRKAQVRHLRPDLNVVDFRGNVQTRLQKLADGVADATMLACAGLERLGMTDRITSRIEITEMLPAVAQGAIAIVAHGDDEATMGLLGAIDHEATHICVKAERAFLAVLDGSCRTPIAGLATLSGGALSLRGQVLSPDGRRILDCVHQGSAASAIVIGERAGDDLISRGAAKLFDGSA